jgi:uncharacterized protein
MQFDKMGSRRMSDYKGDFVAPPLGQPIGQAGAVAVDEGLRAYMLHIYNYMAVALAITGAAAFGTYLLSVTADPTVAALKLRDGLMLTNLGKTLYVGPLKWAVVFAPLALVFAFSMGIERMRPATAQIIFWIYSALVGVSLATIFMVFTHTSIVRVFFITAASFGVLSLWGYTTQRDLNGIGSFLLMGLFGVILAGLVNLFMASNALQFAISVAGVLVFAGLTAWDTQRLKAEYLYGAMEGETAERSAIIGALSLYLNFINLFTLLLQLLGQRDE